MAQGEDFWVDPRGNQNLTRGLCDAVRGYVTHHGVRLTPCTFQEGLRLFGFSMEGGGRHRPQRGSTKKPPERRSERTPTARCCFLSGSSSWTGFLRSHRSQHTKMACRSQCCSGFGHVQSSPPNSPNSTEGEVGTTLDRDPLSSKEGWVARLNLGNLDQRNRCSPFLKSQSYQRLHDVLVLEEREQRRCGRVLMSRRSADETIHHTVLGSTKPMGWEGEDSFTIHSM